MNVFRYLRLLLYRVSLMPCVVMAGVTALAPGMVRTRVKNLKLVGPKPLVEDALKVLKDFEFASPELRAEIDAKGGVTFLYCPPLQGIFSLGKHFVVGQELISWGKTGILVHMVWTALRLRAGLQDSSTSFRDVYAGNVLLREALSEMIDWLTVHGQPAEFIEDFVALRAKCDAQRTSH